MRSGSWAPTGATRPTSPTTPTTTAIWSRTGRPTAAGSCSPASGTPAMPLQTISPDGTGLAQVPGTTGARSPIWSPDGQRIALPGGGGIVTVKLDGSDPTPPVGVEGTFDWAPVPPNRPPDCSTVTASPAALAPAHGRLRLVTLTGGGDPDGDTVTTAITSVTQDERLTGPGDHTSPDAAVGDSPDQVRLRAESSPDMAMGAFTASTSSCPTARRRAPAVPPLRFRGAVARQRSTRLRRATTPSAPKQEPANTLSRPVPSRSPGRV